MIPRDEINLVLNEAVESNVISRDEIGRIDEYESYDVRRLLRMMRRWRTDFLQDSFSINDISYSDDISYSGHGCSSRPVEERCDELTHFDDVMSGKDTFISTDEAFLSSLRDKTKMITSRRNDGHKKMIRSILHAWEMYERLPVRSGRRYWYLGFPLLIIPLYLLYSQKPF